MRTELRCALGALIITIGCIVHDSLIFANDPDAAACGRTLPANIEMASGLEKILATIYRGSPTFRAQCDRIASDPALSVFLRVDTAIPSSCQAFTRFSKQGRSLHADVHVPPSNAMVMMVGHEFEHIVEQLDGLDMQTLSRVRGSGVYEPSPAVYESVRAQRAGRTVSKEWLAARKAD
jgi:hypothetical protein